MAATSKAKEAGEFEPQEDWGRFPNLSIEAQNGTANKVTRLAVEVCVYVHNIIECMARRNDKIKRTELDVFCYLYKIAPEVFDEKNVDRLLRVYNSLKDWGNPDDANLDPSLQMAIYVGYAVNTMYKLILEGMAMDKKNAKGGAKK